MCLKRFLHLAYIRVLLTLAIRTVLNAMTVACRWFPGAMAGTWCDFWINWWLPRFVHEGRSSLKRRKYSLHGDGYIFLQFLHKTFGDRRDVTPIFKNNLRGWIRIMTKGLVYNLDKIGSLLFTLPSFYSKVITYVIVWVQYFIIWVHHILYNV